MPTQSKRRTYEGEAIDITFDLKRCIHAAECGRSLPIVFDANKRPWVSPDAAPADQIAEVVMRCPSGALQFERKDGGMAESAPEQNTFLLSSNGPLIIRGDLKITTSDGTVWEEDTRLTLCRCGESANKPFCDNAHQQAGFVASEEMDQGQDTVEDQASGGSLNIMPAANGPYLLQGNFEIVNASGTAIFRGEKAALCRCGASANKPFCDGTHKDIDFTAE